MGGKDPRVAPKKRGKGRDRRLRGRSSNSGKGVI